MYKKILIFLSLIFSWIFFFHASLFAQDWYENYITAQKYMEAKNWELALEYLNKAIDLKKNPEKDARAHGLNFIDYFPYLHRGITYFQLGKYENAWLDLRESEERGIVKKNKEAFDRLKYYQNETNKKRDKFISKGETKSLRELVRKVFENTKTWGVFIGINTYNQNKNGYNFLPHAVIDAESMKKLFVEEFKIPAERVFLLLNADATKKNIENLLGDKLPKLLAENDRLIIYFSGHGETHTTATNEYGYLIPFDGEKKNLYSTCLSMNQIADFSNLIAARQILFIIDACYSGIAGVIHKGGEDLEQLKKINEAQMKIFMESRGRQIMTAGTSKETARMGKVWNNHSVYTYYLMKGLKGEADWNKDSVVSTFELQVYLNTYVSKDTENKQNPQLYYLDVSEGQFVFYREGDY
ncbi:caspase family protein [candidate division KSB1 bacterium]|nr:caspase family protein [candidate division KSB1 bacterium]